MKKAFRELRVPVCGRFYPNEGGVAGYGNRMRVKYTAKWGLQIAEMIFQTRSRASADFSPFVVTDGFLALFPTADETSLGTTRFFLSIYLPHLLLLIPSSYWTLVCRATLSLTVA